MSLLEEQTKQLQLEHDILKLLARHHVTRDLDTINGTYKLYRGTGEIREYALETFWTQATYGALLKWFETPEQSREKINHPSHYGGDTTYEVVKVLEAWGLGFHLGNAVKYIARAGKKDPATEVEDLRKAVWYLERRLRLLENRPKHEHTWKSTSTFDRYRRTCIACGLNQRSAHPVNHATPIKEQAIDWVNEV